MGVGLRVCVFVYVCVCVCLLLFTTLVQKLRLDRVLCSVWSVIVETVTDVKNGNMH